VRFSRFFVAFAVVALATAAFAQAPSPQDETKAAITPYLSFVGVTPCRLVDTREAGFPAGYGIPALVASTARTFVIPEAVCGIPATAKAVSMNVTVVSPNAAGFLAIWPGDAAAQPNPLVSSLNYVPGDVIPNAVIVPLNASGQVTVVSVAAANVIFDVNGYFTDTPASQVAYFPGLISPLSGTDTVQEALSRLAGGWNPGRVMTSSILGTLLDDQHLLWDAINPELTIVDGKVKATGTRGQSYVAAAPGLARTSSAGVALEPGNYGDLVINPSTIGTKSIYIPLPIPNRLLGTDTRVAGVKVCYRTSNAASYITSTYVRTVGDNLVGSSLIIDGTNRTSTSATGECYTVKDNTPVAPAGALNLYLPVTFADAAHSITIGNIEVILEQI
jgi:hypothetical protein